MSAYLLVFFRKQPSYCKFSDGRRNVSICTSQVGVSMIVLDSHSLIEMDNISVLVLINLQTNTTTIITVTKSTHRNIESKEQGSQRLFEV